MHKNLYKFLIVFFVWSILPGKFLFAEQNCSENIKNTSPDSDFLAQSDGVAFQKNADLVWMRCSLGQEWSGGSCQGKAKPFTWREALLAAELHSYGGYEDWRLPNKNELEFIVEESCYSPAINSNVFPETPTGFFWTSSPYVGSSHAAWSIGFDFGSVSASVKKGGLYVRLVRDK